MKRRIFFGVASKIYLLVKLTKKFERKFYLKGLIIRF